LIAHHCHLEASEFIYHIGNAHVYDDHLDALLVQVEKEPYEFAKVTINNHYDNISDYGINDFDITNYKSHDSVSLKMRK